MRPLAMPRPALAADAAGIAAVHVDSWRETYPGMLPDRYLAEMDVSDYEDRWLRTIQDPYRRSAVFVVEEESRVVGFASCGRERDGDERYEGELYAIYLLPWAQGRGLGRTLVAATADALAIRGMTSMVVWVLRQNAQARGFYERLGGVYLRERPLDLAPGFDVPEVSYLWADTAPLRSGAARR
ncbi:MAG TPA: GNAT family N-acetyltransferase [Terriglobales bacterium]|nr:GNAT family N-acetyltransferase [Terriglobales bacterium]